MYSAEQIQAVRRRQVETLLGLTGRTFEGVERLIDLNLRTARSAMAEASQAALAAATARDVQTLFGVRLASVQPAAEKVSAYSRDVADIVSSTSADLARIASAAALEGRQRLFSAADRGAAVTAEVGNSVAEAVAAGGEAAGAAAEASLTSSRQAAEEAGDVLQNAAAEAQAAAAAVEPSIVVSTDAPVKQGSRGRRSAS